MKTIGRFFWRTWLVFVMPWLYISDYFEHQMIETDYADGEPWSFERTRVSFLQKWHRY